MKSISLQNQYSVILCLIILISCYCNYVSCTSNVSTTSSPRCLPDQSTALLQFKEEFAFQKPNFGYYNYLCTSAYLNHYYNDFDASYPKMLKFWKAEKDCCSWDGVTCDLKTGQIVGLDLANSWLQGPLHSHSSLFKLRQLQKINLSFNNFSSSPIPSEFGQLLRLTHLNLSFSMFAGNIPSEISFLTNLVSLGLSSFKNSDETSLLYLRKDDFTKIIQNMTNLRKLHLRQVNISSSIPESLANLSSLTSLSLDGCGLHGKFPEKIFQFPNLQDIYVPCNYLLTGVLPKFQSSSSLRSLILDHTNFSGKFPDSIGNLKSLRTLSLWNCNFVGPIPSSFWNLSQLTYLELSWNHFSGYELPPKLGKLAKLTVLALQSAQFSGELPSSLGKLTTLEHLSLSNNSFSGQIPTSIENLRRLKHLDLSYNNLNGSIPSFLFRMPALNELLLEFNQFTGSLSIQNISSSQLELLHLQKNKLNGQIPWLLFMFVNLADLSLDHNNFSGTVEFGNFSKLSKLHTLSLSFNSLSVTTVSTSLKLPKFRVLRLASCKLREFPDFLEDQDQLEQLDLSKNRIEGQIPNWFWGAMGKKKLNILNLSGNKLQGSLTVPPLFISYFDVSGNNLSGRIHPSFRKLTHLNILDMSYNHFSGTLPQWLGNISGSLEVLNLQWNNFHGDLCQMFTYAGSMQNLKKLDLSHNQLQGKLPQSLINCSKLQVLDLGDNKIIDTFPFWLQNLPDLGVLILRGNKFYGPIWHPDKLLGFKNLQIVDLSFNSFSGSLPSEYFRNWGGMVHESQSKYLVVRCNYCTYYYSTTLMNKGQQMKFRRTPAALTSIDLSNNKFDGEIPSTTGNLLSLVVLNLSGNSFTGSIPLCIGNMRALESLDLSKNKLSGSIPGQLTSLTFLEYLNLSHNQLTGPIPRGTQLDTFSDSSFLDNPGLCGFQLSKNCDDSIDSREVEPEDGFSWKVVVMGYGLGLVVGLIMGHVTPSRRWKWFWRNFMGI